MTKDVSVAEAKAHFSECVKDAEAGAAIMITRRGKTIAAIVRAEDVAQLARLRAAGPARGLARVAGKFDDAQEFVEDVERIARSRRGRRRARRRSRRCGSKPAALRAQPSAATTRS
jgi:prevent-host-death family protein